MTPSKPGREEECQTRDCPACVAAGCCRCDATVADAHAAGFREGLDFAASVIEAAEHDCQGLCAKAIRALAWAAVSPTPPAAAPVLTQDEIRASLQASVPNAQELNERLRSTFTLPERQVRLSAPVSAATVECPPTKSETCIHIRLNPDTGCCLSCREQVVVPLLFGPCKVVKGDKCWHPSCRTPPPSDAGTEGGR